MAGQPGRQQSSFASGELGDMLAERTNLKYYRSGLTRAENITVYPQGPATLRPYTRQLSRRRRTLEAINMAGVPIGAVNGGTPANAFDGNSGTFLTTGALSGGPHVVLTIGFTTPQVVAAVDVNNYFASAGTGRILVEYQNGAGAWIELNLTRNLIGSGRSRRFCAPPAQPVTASQWRVSVRELSTSAAINIGEVRFWREGASVSAAKVRPFAFSREAAYDIVLMAGHGDVYSAEGGWLTGFALPHSAVQIGRWRQRLNTAILFSDGTLQPWRIFRENADYEWQTGAWPLSNIPNYDFGDTTYGNAVPAIWALGYVNIAPGDIFTMTVDGEETDAIEIATTIPLTAAEVAFALDKLPNINPGFVVSSTLGITFSGAGNEGPVTINSTRVLNKGDGAVSYRRLQKGTLGGESIISAGRGWPRAGIFYQQRLMMGGARLVPASILVSMSGDFSNFNTEISASTGGFVAPMDTDEDELIEDFIVARSLLIFTSRSEYWLTNSTIDKQQVLNPVKASSHGCAPGVPVVENEGAAVFADREGSVICEFRYNETDQTFVTTRLSLLASHLVTDVADLALRRSTTRNDANVLAVLQKDGALRLVTLLRAQDVTAFSRVTTDGLFRSICVNAANRMTALVDRQVNGETVQFVERFEDGLLLDQAVTKTLSPASATVTGLADHEGASVWAIADGNVFGPFTVSAGSITLPVTASSVTVGRWTPFLAETLPPTREIGPDIVTQSNIGFATVRVSLADTTSVAIGANGQPAEDVPLLDFGMAAPAQELAGGYTGLRQRDGLQGSAERPSIVVTQLRPGRITLRAITGEGDM
ncbi:hypothetical protein [Ancylobacter sp. SL191]|uniref:hypothetical protein n=1 Tax=Ancylobacter sp. SL191 TaxID=2995166 RepID=UPI00226E67B7|nr:hypothetical protein [Ancylobacter sp. SL191]WAC26341.1 hypothetical protein OU996_15145 [Ancylobacter sp. SL191]